MPSAMICIIGHGDSRFVWWIIIDRSIINIRHGRLMLQSILIELVVLIFFY